MPALSETNKHLLQDPIDMNCNFCSETDTPEEAELYRKNVLSGWERVRQAYAIIGIVIPNDQLSSVYDACKVCFQAGRKEKPVTEKYTCAINSGVFDTQK
jgi:hypothetical protein